MPALQALGPIKHPKADQRERRGLGNMPPAGDACGQRQSIPQSAFFLASSPSKCRPGAQSGGVGPRNFGILVGACGARVHNPGEAARRRSRARSSWESWFTGEYEHDNTVRNRS